MLLLLRYCYDVMQLMQKGFVTFDVIVLPLFEVSLFCIYENSIDAKKEYFIKINNEVE